MVKMKSTLTTKGKSKKQKAMIRKAMAAGVRQGKRSKKRR